MSPVCWKVLTLQAELICMCVSTYVPSVFVISIMKYKILRGVQYLANDIPVSHLEKLVKSSIQNVHEHHRSKEGLGGFV